MAKKIDDKTYYTFVGLINRMNACRDRRCLKDIPEEVEFKGLLFRLNENKTSYYYEDVNGEETDIASVVADYYGDALDAYLTEFEFIVCHKEKVKATHIEYLFIKYMSMFGDKPATHVSVENVYNYHDIDTRALYLWEERTSHGLESYTSVNVIDIGHGSFVNFEPGVKYKIKDVEENDD